MIDLHAHILPGLDDGVRTIEEARELAISSIAEGVTAIAATPHVRGDYPTTPSDIERGVLELRRDFASAGIAVEIIHGAEVELARIWEVTPEELRRLTFAQGGRYLLVEFPYRGWPTALITAVKHLHSLGMTPVLAHPERNPEVQDTPSRLVEAVEAGCLVQITATSVEGLLGRASQAAAHRLLELQLVHVLATDAHGSHARSGGLAAASHAIGEPEAEYLTVVVPHAIVAGRPIPDRVSGR